MPAKRYIGAFGVTAWATRSGSGLLAFGDQVRIERTKPQATLKKTGKLARSAQKDVVVRFTNLRGEEIGRLENDSAAWISTLLDQKVCTFQGTCVFAPEGKLRTNDNIYLQLRCFLLKSGFESGNLTKPVENNRKMNLFEAKESSDERELRLRQVALIKMFDEIKLLPTQSSDKNVNQKREKLLEAAEAAEQKEKQNNAQVVKTPSGTVSPPIEEVEEGEELEQDQLDTLYKKAQSFDFDTPTAEPADSFVMDLRKYQKQALYWMMGKEKDEKSEHKERVMHPLWEEYAWPTKDVDDNELADVVDQASFYVNPYSGELSLDFPLQEQNCLGGILADGKPDSIPLLMYAFTNSTRNGSWEDH
jgi:DNA repair protein RAD5